MIRRLEIRGLVVFEEADIELGPGLTAITGETGAGKSVLMQSLGLLAGGPADASLVRPGHTHALVQATLALPDGFWDRLDDDDPALGLRELAEDETEVTVARRIPREGRARAYLDGQAVTRDAVASLVAHRIRFSGQGEQRRLVSPARQLALLDAFAGDEAVQAAQRLAQLRRRVRGLDRQIASAADRRRDAERHRADLEDLIARVDAVAPDPAELAGLRAERERLRNVDRLAAGAAAAAEALSPADADGGALVAAGEALREVRALAALDPALAEAADALAAADASLQDASHALRGYLDALDADPGRLEFVETRIQDHVALERRYGRPVDEVLAMADRAREDLAALDGGAGDEDALRARRDELVAEARGVADDLHGRRRAAAGPLGEAVSAELAALAMAEGAVRVALTRDDAEIPGGSCTFWFRANAGLPEAPLADAASGGELSRVLLALSGVAADRDDAAWVFDEIDAGLGGATAETVADRLARMGARGQVIVITHLAQVAAAAGAHHRLRKAADASGVASTAVERVAATELVAEIGRLLGGADRAAEIHAEALLARRGG